MSSKEFTLTMDAFIKKLDADVASFKEKISTSYLASIASDLSANFGDYDQIKFENGNLKAFVGSIGEDPDAIANGKFVIEVVHNGNTGCEQ